MRLFWLTLTLWFLAGLALLTAGGVYHQHNYLTRGIPAALPEPVPHGGAELGLNVALEQYTPAEQEQELAHIASLGIRHLKQTFYFTGPEYDWSVSDQIIGAVQNQPGLELTVLLNGNPADNFAPPDKELFARWAWSFAQRYGSVITYYMVWDEPNLTSQWGFLPVNPAEYGALLTATAHAIREADSNAVIITAPLAPTVEQGPQNLADTLFLQGLYENGAQSAFDVVAGKPYGFDTSPADRQVDLATLNFSRLILLHEQLAKNGEAHKAVWGGNWGWNSLPADWSGAPSVWGETTAENQITYLVDGLTRAQQEWPWAGVLFVQQWHAPAPAADPVHGFDLRNQPYLEQLTHHLSQPRPGALPGFHPARPFDPYQQFTGGWEFSPQFGADMSQVAEGADPDRVTFTFWGTEVGARVRRANFRARFYVTVDGQPANALPLENGRATLVLTTADPAEDYIRTELLAEHLPAGLHTVELVADRGWDQWALNGFAVGYRPDPRPTQWQMAGLVALALLFAGLGITTGRRVQWAGLPFGPTILGWRNRTQFALTSSAAALTALLGWLTWGEQVGGLYRRLGDGSQLGLVAGLALIFYITPWFWGYVLALGTFFVLVYYRPVWGLVVIAFCFPFYVPQVLKPVFNYRFSPVEMFTLTTTAAFLLHWFTHHFLPRPYLPRLTRPDLAVLTFVGVATLSLAFTERLDVATNEWRLVIFEPALLYFLLRALPLTQKEVWWVVDGWIAGGVLVALIGLGQYVTGDNLITAEAGLMRLRSIYGSPNNVALYLGRMWPLVLALVFFVPHFWQWSARRLVYLGAAGLLSLAILLSFSKGALLLSLPAASVFLFVQWQKQHGRAAWPWLLTAGVGGVVLYGFALQIPALSERLSLASATGVFRLHLWQASLNMFWENPWFGVGLDNFLYAYRGRYILAEAWQEPNLNHPHNLVLDFATRLGIFGLLSGGWMLGETGRGVWHNLRHTQADQYLLAIGLAGGLLVMVVHGLVDHSFFLVDLAYAFFLILGLTHWLGEKK